MAPLQLSQSAYRTLSEFRYVIRRFLAFSQRAAEARGLTPRHHQALLAIKGYPGEASPTVGDLAQRLCIQHNSAVELVDRLVEADLLTRTHDAADRRRVKLHLTPFAERHLATLSAIHLEELRRLRPVLQAVLDGIGPDPGEGAVAG